MTDLQSFELVCKINSIMLPFVGFLYLFSSRNIMNEACCLTGYCKVICVMALADLCGVLFLLCSRGDIYSLSCERLFLHAKLHQPFAVTY